MHVPINNTDRPNAGNCKDAESLQNSNVELPSCQPNNRKNTNYQLLKIDLLGRSKLRRQLLIARDVPVILLLTSSS